MSNNIIPQRHIIISVSGIEDNASVFYTYTSPIYGTTFINSPVCDISVDQPTYTLFLLDFASSMNGWTITGITPKDDPSPLDSVPGPQSLSIMTINPYNPLFKEHAYAINYVNTITRAEISRDPQEGNVNPPN